MGVDAEMFARHRGEPLTDLDLRRLAGRMCSIIGASHFFVQREPVLSGDEPRHALSLCPTVHEAAEEAKDWLEEGQPSPYFGLPKDAPIWEQDGEPIIGEVGEQFIKVHLWTRYYGPDYERGDWPTIRATAEFLERALPGCEVWYGGDSSGICASLLDRAARDAMDDHFYSVGHEPYRSYSLQPNPRLEHCDFCDRDMHDNGGGGPERATFWHCDGCDLKRVTEGGRRHDLPRGVDFFDWRKPKPASPPVVERIGTETEEGVG